MNFYYKSRNIKIIFFFILFYIVIFFSKSFTLQKNETKLRFVKFTPQIKIYTDRDYLNTLNNVTLTNKILLQQPRHNKKIIRIKSDKDVKIIRAICNKNINKNYRYWKRLSIRIKIQGFSCTHTYLIEKKFKSGYIYLQSGGPIASDPIFIEINTPGTRLSFF